MKRVKITVALDVVLPPISTDLPGGPYSQLTFFVQWILNAPGMRADENLLHLFEWEGVLEEFDARTAALFPPLPAAPSWPEGGRAATPADFDQKAFGEALGLHAKMCSERSIAIAARRVGESFLLSPEAFTASKAAAKTYLDERLAVKTQGSFVPMPWGLKILRHYHAFINSPTVDVTEK